MRLLLSPRWMAWHVLTLGAMVTCGFLAAWQWGRAGSAMGSALNIGYGLQWPLFAVFFGVMWWRFLRMEITTARAREEGAAETGDRPTASGTAVTAGGTTGAAAARADTSERERPAHAAGRLAAGQPAPAAEHSAAAGDGTAPATAAEHHATAAEHTATGAEPREPGAERTATGGTARPSPFTARPAGVTPPRSTDPQLRAYNEELARLAARPEETTS